MGDMNVFSAVTMRGVRLLCTTTSTGDVDALRGLNN